MIKYDKSVLVLVGGDHLFHGTNHRINLLVDYLEKSFQQVVIISPHQEVQPTQELVDKINSGTLAKNDLIFQESVEGNTKYFLIPPFLGYKDMPVLMKNYVPLLLENHHFDICYSHGVEMADLPKKIKATRIVDHTIYLDVDYTPGFEYGDEFKKAVMALEEISIESNDLVISVSQELADLRQKRYPDKNIIASPNGVKYDIFAKVQSEKRKQPVMIYTGWLGPTYGVQFPIYAMPQIMREIPEAKYIIIGFGSEEYKQTLKNIAEDLGVEKNVIFYDKQPYEKLPDFLKQARIGIATFKNSEINQIVCPLKVFEYFAAGLPVLGADFGGLGRIMKESNAGVSTKSFDDIAQQAISIFKNDQLFNTFKSNAIEYAKNYDINYLLEKELQTVISFFYDAEIKGKRSIKENVICNICGSEKGFDLNNPDGPRESWNCRNCGCTSRDRMYIYALAKALNEDQPLCDWEPNKSMKVLESAGARAHPNILEQKYDYKNTTFDPEIMAEPGYDFNKYVDLQTLRFGNETFDVIMNSDVFEHIRLHIQALEEIYRVLKPGGLLILTVPMNEEKDKTIVRVQPEGDEDKYLLPAHYHAEQTLVYRDYGMDFIKEIESCGFEVELLNTEIPKNCITPQKAFIVRKPAATIPDYLYKINIQMKNDWDERAKEDALYYVYSSKRNQSEADFDASGRKYVKQLITEHLDDICGNRDPKYMKVLEIGCGLGRMTKYMADIFGEVHGVDVSGEMIKKARERLALLKNVYLYENNGYDLLDFKDNTFDFIFSFIVFQHIPSKNVIFNYIREAYRVMKPNAIFKFQVQGCLDPDWLNNRKDTWEGVTVTEDEVRSVADKIGFKTLSKSGQGTQYSWFTLKKSGTVFSKSKEEKRSKNNLEHLSKQSSEYKTKIKNEIATYENVTDVHQLPEVHSLYGMEILNHHLLNLTGSTSYQKWWIDEIKYLTEKLNRTVKILSLACGNGDTEITLLKKLDMSDKVSITGIDINPVMIARAEDLAKKNKINNAFFEVHDLNFLKLNQSYDVILANHSLHHIVNLEDMFEEISKTASNEMIFLINDMIGRNGHVMWDNAAQIVRSIWNIIDKKYKLNTYSKQYDIQPYNNDCSVSGFEGIRAEDILPNLIKYFDIELFFPFSVFLNRFVDRTYGHNFNVKDQKDIDLIKQLIELDAKLLTEGKLSPTQAFIKVQKKGTVKRTRWVFQKPEQAIQLRNNKLNENDYISEIKNVAKIMGKHFDKSFISKMEESKVSIIIPVFNNLSLTHKCLKSILENTKYSNYEIVIVDNASTDGTIDYLKKINDPRFKLHYNPTNKGFVKACNLGAKNTDSDFVLLLNNDTEVQPGWLSSLVNLAESRKNCGAVGSKLVYPDGTLQEAGGIIFSDGNGWNFGRGLDPADPRFNFVREVDYCSGAALMIKKEIWDRLGGLDEQYSPAYYEDTDFCFSIGKLGYKVYYQPESTVIHYEGQTAGTDVNKGFKKYQNINRHKFLEKWKKELSNQQAPGPQNVLKASNRNVKGSIFVADPFLPMYDRASGSLRLFSYLKILKELGFHITYLARLGSDDPRYKLELQQMGIEVYENDELALNVIGYNFKTPKRKIDYKLLFNERQFDQAILSFWDLAEYYLPLIRKYSPSTKIIIDTVDLHFIRELREAELNKDLKYKKEAEARKKKELAVYKKSDSLWTVTENDRKILRKHIKNKSVKVVPNIHSKIEYKKSFDKSSDLLFVGNFAHRPNSDAVKYFVEKIWPEIVENLPDVKLNIVGNNPPREIMSLANNKINVTGYVPDLDPYLKNARISVNPLRYGAGMKGKIGEALSWGLPVVTTSIGAEGMSLKDGEHALIGDNEKDFTEKVIKLYNNKTLWEKLSQNGKKLAADNWSPDSIKLKLSKILIQDIADSDKQSPSVSIIMLTYNALEYTKKCVESIRKYTKIPYEIVFVDNGSKDGTKKYLRELLKNNSNYKLVNNSKNMGFAAGNNQGVKQASTDYVLLLNNDVEVSKGWLESMLRSMQLDEKIGMVGPITNCISGLQQVKDIPYKDNIGFLQYAKNVRQVNEGVITPRRRIAGFAMLMPKKLYEEVGGFDTSFGTGNFEDDDLCLRVREKGYAIMVDESTFIHHYGSQTFSENEIDYKESLKQRKKIFNKKWPDVNYEELLEIENPLFKEHELKIKRAYDLLTAGKADEAFNVFKSILTENPISGESLLGAAYCNRQLQKHGDAIMNLQKLIQLQPDNALALNQLGLISMESEDFDNAEFMFSQAIKSDNQFVDAQRNYADLLIQKGDFESGIVALNTILENHPEDIQSLTYLAQLNLEAGRIEECNVLVEKILTLDPDNSQAMDIKKMTKQQTTKVDQPGDLHLQAQENLEKNKYEEAKECYQKILTDSPDEVAALYGLGLVYQLQYDYANAKTYFEKVKTLATDYEDVYNNLGIILMQEGKFEEAIDHFKHVLQINPENVNAQLNVSDTLVQMQQYEEGIQALQFTLQQHPNEVNALLRMGSLYQQAGNDNEANNYFSKVLEIEPGNEIAREALM